jgi:FkbM family methyltransferase
MNNSNEFWPKLRWKLTIPEYIYRPRQIFVRWKRKSEGLTGLQVARLPWGVDIGLQLGSLIPNSIWFKGCYDIVMGEAIWRLLDKGEIALDVGANFGYFTSLMAARGGKTGKVIAFEPHPGMFEELRANCDRWHAGSLADIALHQIALSSHGGTGTLVIPESWSANPGVAFIEDGSAPVSDNSIEVKLARLDEVIPAEMSIGVAKFDIEGHEAEAFAGAERLLSKHKMRDIIFEDQRGKDTPAKRILADHGYTLFSLAKYFRGPRLCNIDGTGTSPRDDANFLATIDPDRAVRRMSTHGWITLRGATE